MRLKTELKKVPERNYEDMQQVENNRIRIELFIE